MEALDRGGLFFDRAFLNKSYALGSLGNLRPETMSSQIINAPETVKKAALNVVDALLADTRNHFICCGKSWTYAELTAHTAREKNHIAIGYPREWLTFGSSIYDESKFVVSPELLRMIRVVSAQLHIQQPTRAALEAKGEIFICSCDSAGAKARSWDQVVSHHLQHQSYWYQVPWGTLHHIQVDRRPILGNDKIGVPE